MVHQPFGLSDALVQSVRGILLGEAPALPATMALDDTDRLDPGNCRMKWSETAGMRVVYMTLGGAVANIPIMQTIQQLLVYADSVEVPQDTFADLWVAAKANPGRWVTERK